MELIRGKTFIKSSAPLNFDKQPLPDLDFGKKEDAAKIFSPPVIGEPCQVEAKQISPVGNKTNNKCSNRTAKVGQREEVAGSAASSKVIPKGKTHDSTLERGKSEHNARKDLVRVEGFSTPGKIKGRLIGSASFSGTGNDLNVSSKRDAAISPCQSSCSQKMIDYRNFVPQVPFVLAVAKSIPRKRISLKRSKKGLRDIFHIKKNKQESLTLALNKDKTFLPELSGWVETTHHLKSGDVLAGECLAPELSDGEILFDSTYDYCRLFCEDAASLKSFDSLTGCGEIFADESSAHMEYLNGNKKQKARSMCKRNQLDQSFQGGMEQLASPAQQEAIDFPKFWGHVNQSGKLHQGALFDRRLLKTPNSEEMKNEKKSTSLKEKNLLVDKGLETPNDSSPETDTLKSDIQEPTSTSDEGYYDSFSPGLDDEKKEKQTPVTFPRDSYSGDALYDLFYDHSEAQISPILDDELSLCRHTNEPPLSTCSFHVGAEENMASRPSIDLMSQGFLQSSWNGKECLLKLCDTELSLTMGIINWLRNNPGIVSPTDPSISPQTEPREISTPMVLPDSSPCLQTASIKKVSQLSPVDIYSHGQATSTNNENGLPPNAAGDNTVAHSIVMSEHVASKNNSTKEAVCGEGCNSDCGFQVTSTILTFPNSSDQTSEFHGHTLRGCSPVMVRDPIVNQCVTPHDKGQVMVAIDNGALCPTCRNCLECNKNEIDLCCICQEKLQKMEFMQASGKSKLHVKSNKYLPCPPRGSHSKSFMSPAFEGRGQTIVQILEQCAAQIASLQITYKSEEKNAESKCLGNEMKNLLCKMSQYRKNILCPSFAHLGHKSDDSRLQENRLNDSFLNKVDLNPSETPKSVHFRGVKIQHTSEKNLGEAQVNSLIPSHCTDAHIQLSPVAPPHRPNFLPLFGSFSPHMASEILPAFCQDNFQDVSECNQTKENWKLSGNQDGLTVQDVTPPPEASSPEETRSRANS
ncbi:APC membrane recruitment protein 3 isoform X2 [Pleurodeles waltl]